MEICTHVVLHLDPKAECFALMIEQINESYSEHIIKARLFGFSKTKLC